MFLNFSIEHIPEEIRTIATKAAAITKTIEADLQGGLATDLALLIPGGTQLQEDLINVCKGAILACNAVSGLAGNPAYSAILQRLGADLVKIEHDSSKRGISFYITSFEVVFHDLFGA